MTFKIFLFIGHIIFLSSCCNDTNINTNTNSDTIIGTWILESVVNIETGDSSNTDNEYGCEGGVTTFEFFGIANNKLRVVSDFMFAGTCRTNEIGEYDQDQEGTVTFEESIPPPKQVFSYRREDTTLTLTDTNDNGTSNFRYTFIKVN